MEFKKIELDKKLESDTIQKIAQEKRPVAARYREPPNYERFDAIDVHWGPVNDTDYGWHFAPWHAQRPFEQDLTYPCRVIVTHLGPLIPQTITVDVMLPPPSWELKLITVIAKNALNMWSFDERRANTAIPAITAMLNEYVRQVGMRRRRAF